MIHLLNEIKIGTRIFKFYSKENIIVVGNSDYNIFNQIRALAFENIEKQENVKKIDMYYFNEKEFFDYNTDENKIGFKPVINVDFEFTNNNGTISFKNTSFIDYGDSNFTPNYIWEFSDGYTYQGKTCPDYSILEDSVKVILKTIDRKGDTLKSDKILIFRAPCWGFGVEYSKQNPKKVIIDLEYVNINHGANLFFIRWGDGSFEWTSNLHPTHTYKEKGIYKIIIEYFYSDWKTSRIDHICGSYQYVKIKNIECKRRTGSIKRHKDKVIGGKIYRCGGKIWISKYAILGGFKMGARTGGFKKGFLGFHQKKLDRIWVRTGGYYFENDPVPCEEKEVYEWEVVESNSNYVGNEEEAKKPGINPKIYWSKHRAKMEGTEWSVPGRLELK